MDDGRGSALDDRLSPVMLSPGGVKHLLCRTFRRPDGLGPSPYCKGAGRSRLKILRCAQDDKRENAQDDRRGAQDHEGGALRITREGRPGCPRPVMLRNKVTKHLFLLSLSSPGQKKTLKRNGSLFI